MKTIHDGRYKALIERMIALRDELAVSQTELATRLGKPQSYVAKVETLERRMDLVEFRDWMEALQASPNLILNQLDWWQPPPGEVTTR